MSGQSHNRFLSIFYGSRSMHSKLSNQHWQKSWHSCVCSFLQQTGIDSYTLAALCIVSAILASLYCHGFVLLPGKTGSQEYFTSLALKKRHSWSESSVLWHPCMTWYQHVNQLSHGALMSIMRHIALMMLRKDTQITPSMSSDCIVHEILMSQDAVYCRRQRPHEFYCLHRSVYHPRELGTQTRWWTGPWWGEFGNGGECTITWTCSWKVQVVTSVPMSCICD